MENEQVNFRIEEDMLGDIGILRIEGQVKAEYGNLIRDKIMELIEEKGAESIVINLSKVTFLNSFALTVFLEMYKMLQKQGGKLVIAEPSAEVSKLLEITRLNTVLEVYETEREAMNVI